MRERKKNYTEEDVRRAAEQTEVLNATAVRESEEEAENRRIAARITQILDTRAFKRERAVALDKRAPLLSPFSAKFLTGRAL